MARTITNTQNNILIRLALCLKKLLQKYKGKLKQSYERRVTLFSNWAHKSVYGMFQK